MNKIIIVLVFTLVVIALFFIYPEIAISVSFYLALVIKAVAEILKVCFDRKKN